MNVLILHPERVEKIIASIKQGGFQKLHILSDFDRTLTYGSANGVMTPSIISLLRDGKHLKEGYAEKAHELYATYHPKENDLTIPIDERKRAMKEWWDRHNRLLIESELTRGDIDDIVSRGHLKFRDGVFEFLDFLHAHDVPLVILSASGCGDAIRLFFQKMGADYSNIVYLLNQFQWDETGRVVGTNGQIIHSLNKDETTLKEMPKVYEKIKDRKNVILLGDSIGDAGMISGFDYDVLLKIGFLNIGDKNNRDFFSRSFDVVLEGDGDFSYVNDLIRSS